MSIQRLIKDTISSLRKGTTQSSELGAHYAHLLEVLWSGADQRPGIIHEGRDFDDHTWRTFQQPLETPQPFQEGFSWLDLEAVGDFVWNDSVPNERLELTNIAQSVDALRRDFDWNSFNAPAGEGISWIF